MSVDRPSCAEFLPSFFVVEYFLFLVGSLLFLLQVDAWSAPVAMLLIPALFVYPLFYLLPSLLLTTGAAAATLKLEAAKPVLRNRIIGGTAVTVAFISHLLLLMDAGLYFRYSYHINPHVVNIFTTPGGFEAMGLRNVEIFSLAGGILVLALVHFAVIFCVMRYPVCAFTGRWHLGRKSWKYYLAGILFFGAMFLTTYITYTYEHFTMNPQPLLAADALPLYLKGTSSSLYKSLGFKPPDRDAIRIKLNRSTSLENYPQQAIRRSADRPKYNIVWLACESWAAKLFTPEIMPRTAEFAKKGVRFANHFSGGNVTRQGMFSMFYALPGNYWHPFFAARRGPLFIDWMKEDGYSFKCITSSKFTYPEFDQTIFFQVPQQDLHSDYRGKTWERDQRNLKVLLRSIAAGADSGKPFFSFMFFESPHNPYEFPPEAEFNRDYLEPFSATSVTAKDGPRIFNRAANCARHLDICLGEIFKLLEQKDLLKNTIVVIVGDHGEEFYEHGYLGHSSSFVNEQIKTNLIIYYPGIKPGVYTAMSSHLDIIPMLSKHFGVQNPAADYSCGIDLLAPGAPKRRYSLIANWSQLFFAGTKYKSLIPTDTLSFAKQVITDSNDVPLPDVTPFYQEYNQDLIEVQRDLTRFAVPDQDAADDAGDLVVWFGCIALLFAVIGGVIFWRYRRAAGQKRDIAEN